MAPIALGQPTASQFNGLNPVKAVHVDQDPLSLAIQSLLKPVIEQALQPAIKSAVSEAISASVSESGSQIGEEETGMKKFTVTFSPPLEQGPAIDHWKYQDLTRALGREYLDIDLVEVLEAPNADDLLRDLAITSEHPL
jgi:hypothetical protein